MTNELKKSIGETSSNSGRTVKPCVFVEYGGYYVILGQFDEIDYASKQKPKRFKLISIEDAAQELCGIITQYVAGLDDRVPSDLFKMFFKYRSFGGAQITVEDLKKALQYGFKVMPWHILDLAKTLNHECLEFLGSELKVPYLPDVKDLLDKINSKTIGEDGDHTSYAAIFDLENVAYTHKEPEKYADFTYKGITYRVSLSNDGWVGKITLSFFVAGEWERIASGNTGDCGVAYPLDYYPAFIKCPETAGS